MDVVVAWQDDLTFTGTAESGFSIGLGADPKVGGKNDGFRPMELMALSLAGCTAMDVISILQKKRQEITAFEVTVHAPRAETHPKVFSSAVIRYEVTGRGVAETALLRSIELSAQAYCPAQAMLSKVIPMEIDYLIYEGDSKENRDLVSQGKWTGA